MKIIAPLKARDWFKWKTRINWAITIAAFIILFLILVPFVEWWLAIGVSGLGAFCLFLLYLDRRTIGIQCQSAKCLKIIETNTPWECGFKHCQNENTNAFPFINQCEHCHFIPKAYECHHCGEPIFLSKDKQKFQSAKILVIPKPSEKPAVVKDALAEKSAKQREKKQDLQHKYELTQLETNIALEKKRAIKPDELEQTRKELDRLYEKNIGKEDAGEWKKEEIRKQYADNEFEIDRRCAMV